MSIWKNCPVAAATVFPHPDPDLDVADAKQAIPAVFHGWPDCLIATT
jgi:hypothetical protein